MADHSGLYGTANYSIAHPKVFKILKTIAALTALGGIISAFLLRNDLILAITYLAASIISASFIWGFATIIRLLSELVWLNMTPTERESWFD